MALTVTGCASVKYNYEPIAIDISEPTIGAVSSATVGEQMMRQGTFREHDAISLAKQIKVGVLGTYSFSPGHYLKQGEGKGGAFYTPSNEPGSGRVNSGALTDPFSAIMVPKEGGSICGVTTLGGYVCTKSSDFSKTKIPVANADSFQQTLIYNGRVGSKINVAYRESSGNQARPAFNNEVEYDLGASKTIAYKGALIEIVDANNESITYKVMRNFNKATK